MRSNEIRMGSILSYVQMGISLVVSILYTPLMIRLLGQSEYGLYSTVSSTIALLSLLNLGFSAGYVKYYSKYKKDNDIESIYKLNGLYLILFSIIGLIAFACGTLFTLNIESVYANGLTAAEYKIARVLMMLMTVNTAQNFVFTVFRISIVAHEKFIFSRVLGITLSIIKPLVMIPLLFMGYKSITMVIVTLSFAIAVDFVYIFYFVFVIKQKFIFRGFEKGLFKSLFAYTGFIALHLIVDQINFNIDKTLLGRFCGTAVVAAYAVGYSLFDHYMTFSTAASGVFTPRVHKLINATESDPDERRKVITGLFTKIGRIQYLLLGLIITGIIFFGRIFIYHWAGDGYFDAYAVVMLLAIPCTIPLIQNIGIEIERALNIHKFRCLLYFFMALGNLGLTIFLAPQYGAVGAAIGTCISFVICQGIIINIRYHRRCHINILHFWKNILSIMKGQIIPVAVGILIMRFADMSNIFVMLIWIAVYSAIYCLSVWLLSMNRYEKDLVLAPVKKILGRVLKRKNEQT